MTLGGLVLCGGASRRMGTSKALLDWRGRPLLVHMIEILGGAGLAPLAIAAGPEQELPALPQSVMVLRDPIGFSGPLRGLATGLSGLAPRVSRAFVCSCDAPLLSEKLIHLVASRDAPLVVPEVDGVPQLLLGAYGTELGKTVDSLLKFGKRRMFDLLDAVSAEVIPEAEVRAIDPSLGSFLNCNDPESFAKALFLGSQSI